MLNQINEDSLLEIHLIEECLNLMHIEANEDSLNTRIEYTLHVFVSFIVYNLNVSRLILVIDNV